MKQTDREILIILPEDMKSKSVKVFKNDVTGSTMIQINYTPANAGTSRYINDGHTAIWHQGQYEHIPVNEILWAEANGSYCRIYATNNRKLMLSFPLSRIQKVLPEQTFIRIHRSYLVNINHIRAIVGNCVIVERACLRIGREYRKQVLDRFIFLGVRNTRRDDE